ncbi:hypothetical protein VTO73DRAFT_10962 [Trametes versicolor]
MSPSLVALSCFPLGPYLQDHIPRKGGGSDTSLSTIPGPVIPAVPEVAVYTAPQLLSLSRKVALVIYHGSSQSPCPSPSHVVCSCCPRAPSAAPTPTIIARVSHSSYTH